MWIIQSRIISNLCSASYRNLFRRNVFSSRFTIYNILEETNTSAKLPCFQQYQPRRSLIWEVKRGKIKAHHVSDKVDESYVIVYQNDNRNYYRFGELFCYLIAIPSLVLSLKIMYDNRHDFPDKLHVEHPFLISLGYFIFLFCVSVVTHIMCKKYMLRMYYHTQRKEYLAVTQSWYFRKRKFRFKRTDCKGLPNHTYLFLTGNVSVKNRRYFVNYQDFTLPKYYNELMGSEDGTAYSILVDEDISVYGSDPKKKTDD